MSYALLSNRGDSLGANGGTSGTIDTTGADLIVASVSRYSGAGALTFSDSAGNTWTAITESAGSSDAFQRIYYVQAPTTSATHSFTVSGTNVFSAVAVAAFSGSASNPIDFDVENFAQNVPSLPTHYTPNFNNELIVYGAAWDTASGSPISVNQSFLITDQVAPVGGVSYGVALTYKIQGTLTAETVTISFSSNVIGNGTVAGFQAAAAAAGGYLLVKN